MMFIYVIKLPAPCPVFCQGVQFLLCPGRLSICPMEYFEILSLKHMKSGAKTQNLSRVKPKALSQTMNRGIPKRFSLSVDITVSFYSTGMMSFYTTKYSLIPGESPWVRPPLLSFPIHPDWSTSRLF